MGWLKTLDMSAKLFFALMGFPAFARAVHLYANAKAVHVLDNLPDLD